MKDVFCQDAAVSSPATVDDLVIGTSPAMQKLVHEAERAANSNLPVLITGPTGAGKEVIANLVHRLGSPKGSPFLDVNCSAIPEALIESQLFGHEKGAFTGATNKQEGYFSLAADGVLFLDEVAELPLWQQTKLLRVLESRQFRPVGGAVNHRFRGRVIAATHIDLVKRVEEKRFREDLFYRLNIVQLILPALAERREDISQLAEHFGKKCSRPIIFSPAALKQLERAPWKGNVRELKNTVERMAVMSDTNPINADEVKKYTTIDNDADFTGQLSDLASRLLKLDVPRKLEAIEYATIQLALKNADGNKSAAARQLGVHRKYIERRLATFEKQFDEIYQLQYEAEKMMVVSDYKEAASQLRLVLQLLECHGSSQELSNIKLNVLLKLSGCLRNIYGWNHSEVVSLYDNAQNLAKKLDGPEKVGSLQFGLWVNQLVNLELDKALGTSESYYREGERINNPNIIAYAAISMANTQFWLGDFESTCRSLQKFIDSYHHDQRIVIDFGHDPFVYYLMFKSLVSFQLGKINVAVDSLKTMMRYAREINHPFSLATALQAGAWVSYKMGDLGDCYGYADELKSVSIKHGFPFFDGMAEMFLGHRLAAEGDYQCAKEMIEVAFREKINGNRGRLFNSMYGIILADIAILNQQYQQGLNDIEQTLATSVTKGECCYLAEEMIMCGRLKGLLGHVEAAHADFKKAQAEAEARGSKAAELKVAHIVANYHHCNNQNREARRVLTPVVLRFTEQSPYLELADAQSLLAKIDNGQIAFR